MGPMKEPRIQPLLTALTKHAEDLALLVGSTLLGIGAGGAFGWPAGLMVVGALLVAYGVWITRR